jgi:hypothetical protein
LIILSTSYSLHSKIILNVGDYGFFVLTDRYYRGQLFCHPTLYVLPPLLQVFLEAESVVVAEPEVFALVFAAAELSPEVVVLAAGLSLRLLSWFLNLRLFLLLLYPLLMLLNLRPLVILLLPLLS